MSTVEAWSIPALWLTTLATVGLLIAAIAAGKIALKTLRQIEHDSKAQARPYLYASLAPSLAGSPIYDLVVENTGASTARRVWISCSGFPESPDDVAERLKVFLDVEHTIPPRVRLRNYWRIELATGHSWGDGTNEPAGMPAQAEVVLTYSDDTGNEYTDMFHLDKRTIDFAPVPQRGPGAGRDLSVEQKDTHEMLSVIAQAIGELRR